jgi:hypothetical protein
MIARKLPGLPPYGNAAKNFPKADAFSEGLVVEFTPTGGERWVGNFAAGSKSLECIRDDLGEGAVLVVSGGDVYLVDSKKQQVILELPWVPHARFEADLELLVIADDCEVAALGQSGLKWRSRRVSWDGISELKRIGRSLHGLAYDIHDQPPVPFAIDLETGQATGGSYQVHSGRARTVAPRQF